MENFSSLKVFGAILLTLHISNVSSAQTCRFELLGLDPCNGNIENIQFYELKKGELKIKPRDTTGICIIEQTGEYELVWLMSNYTLKTNAPYKIFIDSSDEHYSDTLRLESISPCHKVIASNPWSGFCNCGEACDGYQVDYYKNGNKRLEGNFKQGKAVGKIIYYLRDGSIDYVEKYNKKGKLKKTIRH